MSADRHDELPLDPERPLHLRPAALGLVFAGGVAGTAARYLAEETVRPWGWWPAATFLVNVAGAFALGVLLESLAGRGPDTGGRRRWRLLLGTGFLGAFTTYSSLAVETVLLARDDRPWLAAAYSAGSVLVGLVAAAGGIRAGGQLRRVRRTAR
jgi:CrcB protein